MSTDINDEESFFINQEIVARAAAEAHEAINKPSMTTVCLDCGEPIGAKRLAAYPSSTLCIDCASDKEARR